MKQMAAAGDGTQQNFPGSVGNSTRHAAPSGRSPPEEEPSSRRMSVHRTFIGKVERGETAVTVDSVAGLCAALGVTLTQFFEPFDEPLEIKGPRRRRP